MNIQNKFKKTNTIYKITKDMDLEGSTLIIPVGCTLDFQGGSFKNGTIKGNGTAIQSELRKIFDDNVVLEGVWDIKEAYPEWFGGKGDGITDNTQAIKNCIKYFTNTYVSAGTYITNQIDDIPSFRTIRGCGKKSIIQANPSMELTNGYLLRTKDGGSGITFSDFVLLGGSNSTESNYKIGGIALRSTSNDANDQWDTRNIIQNVEIKYCYAASIYVGTYQRENKISNCFITHTTNIGINCMGTDNMIIGCTVASSHHEGIVINGNNRVDSCKCFGCGASSTVTGKYALSLIGSKCNVSNVELQQNNYGGCIIQGNSNYVQITCDNNGSGTTNTVLGCHVVGSYNTVSVTSYNFSFHDNQYERYFVSTNWNTVGNNITVNGTPLQKNKMSALSPWSVDNICNNIMWNGYNITQSREVPFDKLVLPDLFRSNGTGSFYVNDSGLSFKLTSVTAVNVDALVQAISIHNSNAIDPDGCFSVKARFHKDGDIDTSVYPIIRVITRYKDSSGTTLTRVDQNTTVNLLDNKDSLDVYALTQYHYLSDKPASILSVSVEFAIRSTKLLSDVSINAYFDDIKIGATTSGNKVKFVNTNIDGTLASKVIIANKLSDFTQENTIYKITTDLNLNTAILELPADCTLDFQGGSISNGVITGSSIKNTYLRPEWFGAKGDGITDDSVAFQMTVNLCKSTNCKVIELSESTYLIDNVIIPSNITLIGADKYKSILKSYANTLNTPILASDDTQGNNIVLRNLTIESSGIRTEYTVKILNKVGVIIDNCYFVRHTIEGDPNDYHGIFIGRKEGTETTYITKFTNNRVNQCCVTIEGTDGYIDHNEIWGIGCQSALHLVKSGNHMISNNQIVGGSVYGAIYCTEWATALKLFGNYFDGSSTIVANVPYGLNVDCNLTYCTISNNNFWHIYGTAIRVKTCIGSVFNGNIFENNDTADTGAPDILLENTQSSSVSNNSFIRANVTRTNKAPVLNITGYTSTSYEPIIISGNIMRGYLNYSSAVYTPIDSVIKSINNNSQYFEYIKNNSPYRIFTSDGEINYISSTDISADPLASRVYTYLEGGRKPRLDNLTYIDAGNMPTSSKFDFSATYNKDFKLYIGSTTQVDNAPTWLTGGVWLENYYTANGYCVQRIFSASMIYTRTCNNNIWSSWYKIEGTALT